MSARWFQFFHFLAALSAITIAWDFKLLALVSLPIYAFMIIFGLNIGLHRGLSHGLLTRYRFVNNILLYLGTMTCLGKPSHWLTVHLVHHQFSDTENDPHSPKHKGFWSVFLNIWSVSGRIPIREVLPQIREQRNANVLFFDKYYFQIILCTYLIFFFSTQFSFVLFAYCLSIPSLCCLLATSLVNGVCHRKGVAKDNFWVSLFTFGEGLHLQHHLAPKRTDYSNGFNLDMTGKFLRILKSI